MFHRIVAGTGMDLCDGLALCQELALTMTMYSVCVNYNLLA